MDSLSMIDTLILKCEQPPQILKSKIGYDSVNWVQLASATIGFYQKVTLVRLNYQGPNCFGLEESFTDLQTQLILMAEELNLQMPGSDQSRIRLGVNFLDNKIARNLETPNTDRERIFVVVADLKLLIQLFKRSFLISNQEASLVNNGPLETILIDLEHSLWIFSKFLKY